MLQAQLQTEFWVPRKFLKFYIAIREFQRIFGARNVTSSSRFCGGKLVKFQVINHLNLKGSNDITGTILLKIKNIPPLLKKLTCEIRSPLLFQ